MSNSPFFIERSKKQFARRLLQSIRYHLKVFSNALLQLIFIQRRKIKNMHIWDDVNANIYIDWCSSSLWKWHWIVKCELIYSKARNYSCFDQFSINFLFIEVHLDYFLQIFTDSVWIYPASNRFLLVRLKRNQLLVGKDFTTRLNIVSISCAAKEVQKGKIKLKELTVVTILGGSWTSLFN